MKVKELRDLTVEELTQKEKDLKRELFELRNQGQLGQVENPSRFRTIKKMIARILTIISEKERA